MIALRPYGCYVSQTGQVCAEPESDALKVAARQGTMTYQILEAHQTGEGMSHLRLKFDALASHDITYVGILQTARASGLDTFPVPYVLTNCHNSLAAVGGTINEDDHLFAHTAAKRYGGIYVPSHLAVIHQYMRECMAKVGHMILGSDSHTRYGALGTMAIGEGGGELAKQLMGRTYDMPYPQVIGIHLKGAPRPGVGPQDVALTLIQAVFKSGFVTNKVLEFFGEGLSNLDVEYRSGIDVMTTETTCLSSIWQTDDKVKAYYETHGRPGDFKVLAPKATAYYDGLVEIDLGLVVPMIALPFHPSHVYALEDLIYAPHDVLSKAQKEASQATGISEDQLQWHQYIKGDGVYVQQGIIAGCAGGTYHNIAAAERYLRGRGTGTDFFSLSVYPSSQPTQIALVQQGIASSLMASGAIWRTAFCGPCFGAGDVPNHKGFSIRHTTRNFPNREGAIPKDGQIASVALMDARSIAATAANGGRLTSARMLEMAPELGEYTFDDTVYRNRIYNGFGQAQKTVSLVEGPNITPWPQMAPLPENLMLQVAALLEDPVTTTDELIPSGETSSYRSNPMRLAQYTLSRRDPDYVGRTGGPRDLEVRRQQYLGGKLSSREWSSHLQQVLGDEVSSRLPDHVGFGSVLVAIKPGDGSAREQAASCQKVLGGWANIATQYATKRYRSNLLNWGMVPFEIDAIKGLKIGDWLLVQGIRSAIGSGQSEVTAQIMGVRGVKERTITLRIGDLTAVEREVLLAGCLINYYQNGSISDCNHC